MIRFLTFILICCIIAALCSCTSVKDYSYLNTDRRNCKTFVRVSERWSWYGDSLGKVIGLPETVCDTMMKYSENYRDTLYWDPAKCPPPHWYDTAFRIEYRYYQEVKH